MQQNNKMANTAKRAERAYVYTGYCQDNHNRLGTGSHRLSPELTPINTGKVLIGSAYQPRPNTIAPDQLWLQDALLTPKQDTKLSLHRLADRVIYALCLVAIPLIWLTR